MYVRLTCLKKRVVDLHVSVETETKVVLSNYDRCSFTSDSFTSLVGLFIRIFVKLAWWMAVLPPTGMSQCAAKGLRQTSQS